MKGGKELSLINVIPERRGIELKLDKIVFIWISCSSIMENCFSGF